LDKLQALRTMLGQTLILTSAYRSLAHNRSVGGATSSQHMLAKAFDIQMTNLDPAVFERAARAVGFTSFGFYQRNNFIHIDTRSVPATWGERWYDPHAAAAPLPIERAYVPERPSEDRDLLGTVAGGGGTVIAAGAVVSSLGSLAPVAQVAALIGLGLAIAAAVYVFRNRIKKLAR